MYKSLKFIIVASFIANFTYVKADEVADKLNIIIEDHEIMKQLGVHCVTGGIASVGFATSVFAGTLLGDFLLRNGTATWIGRQLGITPENMRCDDINIIRATLFTPYILSLIAGSYLMYKTPQWTDTYLLKVKERRTTKENIVVLLSRQLPWPLGIFTGEYLAKEIKKREEAKKS